MNRNLRGLSSLQAASTGGADLAVEIPLPGATRITLCTGLKSFANVFFTRFYKGSGRAFKRFLRDLSLGFRVEGVGFRAEELAIRLLPSSTVVQASQHTSKAKNKTCLSRQP